MIYIALLLAFALYLVRYATAPKVYAVHASTAKTLPDGVHAERRYPPRITRTPDGKLFDIDHRFVGHAVGNSMSSYELPDGVKFVGDLLSRSAKLNLPHGALVVVQAEEATESLCLRAIDSVGADGTVVFLKDSYGKTHPNLPADRILARATHTLKPAKMSRPRWFTGFTHPPEATS